MYCIYGYIAHAYLLLCVIIFVSIYLKIYFPQTSIVNYRLHCMYFYLYFDIVINLNDNVKKFIVLRIN